MMNKIFTLVLCSYIFSCSHLALDEENGSYQPLHDTSSSNSSDLTTGNNAEASLTTEAPQSAPVSFSDIFVAPDHLKDDSLPEVNKNPRSHITQNQVIKISRKKNHAQKITRSLKPAQSTLPEIKFTEKNTPILSEIQISFTGDLLVHKDLYLSVIESKTEDFSILWKETIPLLKKADISYVNLEGPTARGINSKRIDVGDVGFIYDDSVYSGTNLVFNFHPNIIQNLIDSGVDIVSTSNNHTFDRGAIGIDKTIDELDHAGLAFVGTRKKGTTTPLYKIIAQNGFNIAWVACSEMLNGFKDRYSQTLLCYEQADTMTQMIQELKSSGAADVVIVLPHWGVEYVHTPNTAQKKYARLYLEAGADVIIGSHPHVLQPVENYTTKDGRETFIVYSLGNFLAYQRDIDRKTSAVIYLDFAKGTDGSTWIKSYSYEPTTRVRRRIHCASKMKDVVKHAETYLGKYTPVVPCE